MCGEVLSELSRAIQSILKAVPWDIKDGDRKIVRCPECNQKIYIQRNSEKVRACCGGCGIDITADILKSRDKEKEADGED